MGQDTANYISHFEEIGVSFEALEYFFRVEPFFAVLAISTKYSFGNYTAFFVLVALIQTVVFFKILDRLHHKLLFLTGYLFVFYLEFHFNVLRSGLASLFLILSLSYRNSLKSYVFFLLAVFSHATVLIFSPFLVFYKKLPLWLYFVFASLFLLFIFLYSDAIIFKFLFYFTKSPVEFRIPPVAALILLLGWLSYVLLSSKDVLFGVCLFIFSVAWLAAGTFDIFYRFYNIAFLSLLYLMAEKKSFFYNRVSFRPFQLFVFLLIFWFGANVNYLIATEYDRRLADGTGRLEYTFVPYEIVSGKAP